MAKILGLVEKHSAAGRVLRTFPVGVQKVLYRPALYGMALWNNNERTDPVFVLSTARTGSTFFVELLNSADGVYIHGEILNTGLYTGPFLPNRGREAVLRHIALSLRSRNADVFGCNIQIEHLDHFAISPVDLCERFPRAKFLVLYRESLADQFLSLMTAVNTRTWWAASGTPLGGSIRITIDPSHFDLYCQRTRGYYERVILALPEGRSQILSYEQLISQQDQILNGWVAPFLGLKPFQASSRLKRLRRSSSYEEIVENLAEMKNRLESAAARQRYDRIP